VYASNMKIVCTLPTSDPVAIAVLIPRNAETFRRLVDEMARAHIMLDEIINIYKILLKGLNGKCCLGILSLDVRIILKYL
jgi:hypothetical protein